LNRLIGRVSAFGRRIAGVLSLLAMLTALAVVEASTARAQDRGLTVTSWGGAYMAGQREALFKPFSAATGIQIREAEYEGELPKIKSMVDAKNVAWDVVDVTSGGALRGCDDGIFEKLDYARIGPREGFMAGAALDCAVGSVVWSMVVAFDARKFPPTGPQPRTIADFFDTDRFPGPRALAKRPSGNLEMALMADGVAPGDVYRLLATPDGVTRAFDKLSRLKPHVRTWWDGGGRPVRLLDNGEAVMTTVLNGRAAYAIGHDKKPFGVIWDGQVWDLDLWAIPKGTRRLDQAYAFLKFVSDPAVMARMTDHVSYGPARLDAVALATPAMRRFLPNAPENFGNALRADTRFWIARRDELNVMFANWLARK
jgi:putative spermidine/putrescine transport system substrate-binding protein